MNRFFWVSAIALMLAVCGDDDNSAVPSAKKNSVRQRRHGIYFLIFNL